MSTQNLYLKQISCLQTPVNNQGWHEIAHYSPAALSCLVEAETAAESQTDHLAADTTPIKGERGTHLEPVDEPIPWCTADFDHQHEDESNPFQLKCFVYDCSYLSPFVRSLYSREQSAKGWYRWVGPDPVLEVRLPLAPAESMHWVFTATFHAFLDEAQAKDITFEVNNKRKPLDWLAGSTYQSRISSSELYGNAHPGELAVVSLSIAVPEARIASEQDQRLLAFAIRELSLTPA